MKVSKSGSMFNIHGDDLQVMDKIPAGFYTLVFDKDTGYHICEVPGFTHTETKIYGEHEVKIEKLIKAYRKSPRNLGAILSGPKGIGKTLFTKLLAQKLVKENIPILRVDHATPGLAFYLDQIDQEITILFDEFEKNFRGDGRSARDDQSPLLGLFDGLNSSSHKKLFMITCNNTGGLSYYFKDRPGRFHYHFKLTNPQDAEIREYLEDNLEEEYKIEIDSILMFSKIIPLTFDMLRAIVFEINMGTKFLDAIEDLNIISEKEREYKFELVFKNGITVSTIEDINLFQPSGKRWRMDSEDERNIVVSVAFNTGNIVYDFKKNMHIIEAENLKIIGTSDEADDANLDTDTIQYMRITPTTSESNKKGFRAFPSGIRGIIMASED